MRVFIKNAIIKKILIVLVTIIMVSNFVMPNYVCAAQSSGEKLVSGFFYLLGYLGDKAISLMQEIMLGNGDIIKDEFTNQYEIKYSPGMIFANQVPALDINFINPMEKKNVIHASTIRYVNIDNLTNEQITNIFNRVKNNSIKSEGYYKISHLSGSFEKEYNRIKIENGYNDVDYRGKISNSVMNYDEWLENDKGSELNDAIFGNLAKQNEFWISENKIYVMIFYSQDNIVDYNISYSIFKTDLTDEELQYFANNYSSVTEQTEIEYKESVAQKLQSNIATWYVALRTIALVGLLSVLIYIGIRIILSSSSAQDKAKYKNMLKDWLVAVCILFVLHYVMAFMLSITEGLNNIIIENVLDTNSYGETYDALMSDVRNSFSEDLDNVWIEAPGRVIMYLALVILTGVFTFQYLKRVIFMAFLTMIAPLIALTYPLDKIKDGKAQAFSYWLREYIFNCLIQPVHLLLYAVLIANAIDFAKDNILYAIVALAFMVPAEKFIKEMFGMKSSSPTANIGAAAGGALVMSMINKLRSKPPKDDAGSGGGSPSGVRTANRTAGNAGAGGNSTGGTGGNSSGGSGGSSTGGSSGKSAGGSGGGSTGGSGRNSSGGSGGSSSTGAGAGSSNNSTITGSNMYGRGKHIRGLNKVASGAGKFVRPAGGALLGALAATAAIAAQVADGDLFDSPEKAFGQVAGATAVGYAAGKNFVGNRMNDVKKASEWMEKKSVGVEEYNNRRFDRKFYQSDAYKMIEQDADIQRICRASGVKVEEATQTFLNNGISDATKIREALQNGVSGDTYAAYIGKGVDKVKDVKSMIDNGITPDIYTKYKKAGVDDVSKIIDMKIKHPRMSDDSRANWMKLAKNAPRNLDDFKTQMVGRKFNGVQVTDSMAEKIFKQLADFF